MTHRSIDAYDLPQRVQSYDADMERMHPDRPLPLSSELTVLREAGLPNSSAFWLEYRELVSGGRK